MTEKEANAERRHTEGRASKGVGVFCFRDSCCNLWEEFGMQFRTVGGRLREGNVGVPSEEAAAAMQPSHGTLTTYVCINIG